MIACPNCGTKNRSTARFCQQCATPLAGITPPAPLAPSMPAPLSDADQWLAATLTAPSASSPQQAAEGVASPPAALISAEQGDAMEPTQPPTPAQPSRFVGAYELIDQDGELVKVVDRQPWRRCWSCGSTANEQGELFCTSCGAALEGRSYTGQLITGEPRGLALITAVLDPQARETLPHIWDQAREADQTLTIAADTGRAPLSPPLEELDALFVAIGLAQLLRALHAEGLMLGALSPDQIELTPTRKPLLREAPGLARLVRPEAVAEDLQVLGQLLENLTKTPRTTRRLNEDDVTEELNQPGLDELLSTLRTGEIGDAATLVGRLDQLIAERTRPVALRTRVGAATHQGMVRELDEDSYFYTELRAARRAVPQTWGLYIVADGMGGHSAGEVASDLAIRGALAVVQGDYFAPTIDGDLPDEESRLKEIARKAALRANEYVLREAEQRGNDMGTTLTMAIVVGDRAVVANVGDSRTYHYRDGELKRVSKDHSLVQRLVDLGHIRPDDVYTHPQRNAVLRSLGDKPDLQVDVFSLRLKPGDGLLLCSDGQWEMTRDHEMAAIIAAHADPQAACDALIVAGNKAGGDDNITTILVRFEAYS